MKVDTFFQNFELLTDAPNATAKLRELILQLAVMGKLVRQDPNDEPALILIKKIKAKKKRLIEAKELRKQEDLSSVKDEDKVYQLPQNWIWCRWNDIALCIGDVDHKMPAETKEGIPYVSPKDFIEGKAIDFSRAKKISQEDFETLKKKIQPSLGDIIFPRYGTIGENRLVETDIDFLASYSCAVVKNFHSFIEPKYSFYYSLSNLVKKEIERYTNKTTQANVGVKSIKNFIFPLPPLAEQKRIVEKCDRLMSLCDEIEKQHKQKQDSIVRMNESAIAQLLSSQNPDDFRHHWERICNNFDLLYSVPETIPKLRQAILQLAVMGKLVKQDPNDEPAAVLLERIKAEQQQLSKTKRIKQTDLLKSVDNDEFGANLPQGWVIEYLGNLVIDFQNGISKRKSDEGKPIPVLRLADIKNGQISEKSLREIALTTNEIRKYKVSEGDILVIRVNGSSDLVGQFIPCFIQQNLAYCDHLIRMKIPLHLIDQKYLCIFAKTLEARNHISAKTITTAGQKTVNQIGLSSLPVSLPPLAEQKRIVEKCDRLMSLCDTLEAKLKQGRESREKLMEVAAKQVLLN